MATNMPSYYDYDEDYSSDDCSKEDVIAFGSIATPIIFVNVIMWNWNDKVTECSTSIALLF